MNYLTVVGFPSKNVTLTDPVQIYTGKDVKASEDAIAASPCQTFFIHQDGGAARRYTKPEPPKAAAKKKDKEKAAEK